jgi:hypothetical protein
MHVESFCQPKQLSTHLEVMGAGKLCLQACYHLANAMKAGGMPVIRGKSVRPSDAYAFLQANPDWRPFAKKKK